MHPKMALHLDSAISGVLGRSCLDFEFIGAAVQISRALADRLPPGVLVATQPALHALNSRSEWVSCGRVRLASGSKPLEVHVNTSRCQGDDAHALVAAVTAAVTAAPAMPTAVALLSPPLGSHGQGGSQIPLQGHGVGSRSPGNASAPSSASSETPLDFDIWTLRFTHPIVDQQYTTWLSYHTRVVRWSVACVANERFALL